MRLKSGRIVTAAVVAALIAVFFALGFGEYLALDHLKAKQQTFEEFHAYNRALTLGAYVLLYIGVTALSLPGAAVLTLAAGALFGFLPALLVASFASSIGATAAFLLSRFVLREGVRKRFGKHLEAVDAGIRRDGAFYLFTLRLVPIFPFWVVNLLMGLSPMRMGTFFWVSLLGMLPGTAVYVNAGTRLGMIERVGDIFSPMLVLSLALLGVFPLLAAKGVDVVKSRRRKKSSRPRGPGGAG